MIARWLLLVLALLLPAAAEAGLAECLDATCRVTTPDGSRGSGCVFSIDRGRVLVLTAAHVVGRADEVECEFWRQGYQSSPLAGRVVVRAEGPEVDAAVIAVDAARFGGKLPAAIPLAPPGYAVRAGQTLTSAGCALGAWSTGWKGHALRDAGGEVRFVPPPAQGRSGSALFDEEGTQIVGLVRARTMDDQQGIATSVVAVQRQLKGGVLKTALESPSASACGPQGCPSQRLSPFRSNSEPPEWRDGDPWPSLPAAGTTAESTANAETTRRLDRIAELLERLPAEKTPAASPAPASAETAAPAAKTVAEVQEEQGKLRQALAALRQLVEQLAGDVSTLPARMESRLEKVRSAGADGVEEVAKAYIRDLLAEKLADGSLGVSVGKVIVAVLGLSGPLAAALVAGLWLVARAYARRLKSEAAT